MPLYTVHNLPSVQLDLQSMKSIRGFVQRVCQPGRKVDVLINNAGIKACPYELTQDGLQEPSHLRRRSGAFSVRVVKFWNRIPVHLVLSPSVSIFKKQLDSQWSEIFPAAPVSLLSPFIDNFLNTPDYLCFPLPPIPVLLMWLLLALVAIPTINQ